MVGGLWATRLDRPLTEGEEARLLELLPPERRQRLLRLPRREQRREPLYAYRLLTLALERECGWSTLPPMAHTPLGKPYFPDFPEVAFSISHTGGAVLVGVSGQAIGVDIERLRPVAPALLDRFGAGTAEAFFLSWVRREARAKRTGTPVELGEESGLAPGEQLWYPEAVSGCAACASFTEQLRRQVELVPVEALLT